MLDAIPELRSLWNRYSVTPVYLASTEVLASADCVAVLQQEHTAGAEIGTHLHIDTAFPCNVPEEHEHLQTLTQLYTQAFGVPPRSYRAGRYGMTDKTLVSLRALGYKVDTSVTPGVDWSGQGGPNYTAHPVQPYWAQEILEVPVTILGLRRWWPSNGWAKYKWLRPSVATTEQLKSIVDRACDSGIEVLNMTFHTMELIPGASPYVRTIVGTYFYLLRLEAIIGHMVKKGFEPITLEGLHAVWSQDAPQPRRGMAAG